MKRALPSGEVALASKAFEQFFAAEAFDDVTGSFQNLCSVLKITPGPLHKIYPVIKANVRSLCGTNLFQILDKKIASDVYSQQYACQGTKVAVVGGGPCGLRTAIEAQLLGASSIVLEKRTDFGRNNVLHLWPFVIEDLKFLGVKVFFPKFCTGSMDHISIRRLQTILLKVSLILGVRIYAPCEFVDLKEPTVDDHDAPGWRLQVNPPTHPMNKIDIDVLIGAEGKRVTVPGFKRKEFRGKLAIAITANFVNNRTTAEAVVEEISGVAFVYKQDFFNSLYDELGIALENIVYYKDETHYFVMTTKKHSLLDRKVLKKDLQDPIELLSSKNINMKNLLEYIRDACDFCTDYQLPDLQFAVNHHGDPDVAIFDFTSMFAASNSAYVQEKFGKQLLCGLVGDGLLEPFWPTGSGCARGFLGALDFCYLISEWCQGSKSVLQLIAERESIYRLLAQTTSENLSKDMKNYTIDPTTRYPNLNKFLYATHQVEHLYITDDSSNKNSPRRNYISSFEGKSTRRRDSPPKTRPSASSKGRFDDLDFEDDTPAFDFNELRRKMMAASKPDQNSTTGNADDYLNNRSKMIKNNQSSTVTNKSSEQKSSKLKDGNEKVDRQAAMQKISDTFGYGEGKKTNQQKVSQPQVSKGPGPSERKQMASDASVAHKLKLQQQQQAAEAKKKSAATPRAQPPPPKFNFATKPRRDMEDMIDPELDVMLAQLENDEDFQKMSDNEQVAWLESLFFLDSGSRLAKGGLVAPKPKSREPILNINTTRSKDDGQVTQKSMRVLANNSKQTVETKRPTSETPNYPAGLNLELCSLAQQFFTNEGANKKPSKKPAQPSTPSTLRVRPDSESIPERASYQPWDKGLVPEPEEEDLTLPTTLKSFRGQGSPGNSQETEVPPPIPERSDQPKVMMLKLMKNATRVLKS